MGVEFKDYYRILGVDRHADDKTLKSAYRRLARKHHPDVAKTKDAGERFKEINEAYEVLSDPKKRQRYDTLGSDWQRYAQPGPGAPGGSRVQYGGDLGDLGDFSEFFRSVFGDLGGGPPGLVGGGPVRGRRSSRRSLPRRDGVTAPALRTPGRRPPRVGAHHGAGGRAGHDHRGPDAQGPRVDADPLGHLERPRVPVAWLWDATSQGGRGGRPDRHGADRDAQRPDTSRTRPLREAQSAARRQPARVSGVVRAERRPRRLGDARREASLRPGRASRRPSRGRSASRSRRRGESVNRAPAGRGE